MMRVKAVMEAPPGMLRTCFRLAYLRGGGRRAHEAAHHAR
jgi:hypothetical protein